MTQRNGLTYVRTVQPSQIHSLKKEKPSCIKSFPELRQRGRQFEKATYKHRSENLLGTTTKGFAEVRT